MNVSLFEAGHISPTHINQSNAAMTTNIPTTTTIPVGPLVNPIFTPPPSGRQFFGPPTLLSSSKLSLLSNNNSAANTID